MVEFVASIKNRNLVAANNKTYEKHLSDVCMMCMGRVPVLFYDLYKCKY